MTTHSGCHAQFAIYLSLSAVDVQDAATEETTLIL